MFEFSVDVDVDDGGSGCVGIGVGVRPSQVPKLFHEMQGTHFFW